MDLDARPAEESLHAPMLMRADFVHTMLLKALKKQIDKVPVALQLQKHRAQMLLRSPIGRDLTLVTTAGVEFTMHSLMLIGGPKSLQEWMFPGGAPQTPPPTSITLPSHFHPILVDRLVGFLYTSEYDVPPPNKTVYDKAGTCVFTNASFVPRHGAAKPEMAAFVDGSHHMFHMQMYALGEDLQYDALKTATQSKLWDLLVPNTGLTPSSKIMTECINAAFSPPGSDARICKDKDYAIQQLIVVVLIVHEIKHCGPGQVAAILKPLKEPVSTAFSEAHYYIKTQNVAMIGELSSARLERAAERKARRKGKVGIDIPAAHLDAARHISGYEPLPNTRVQTIAKPRRENKLKMRAKHMLLPATLTLYNDGSLSFDPGNEEQRALPDSVLPDSLISVPYDEAFGGNQPGHRVKDESYEEEEQSADSGVGYQGFDADIQDGMARMGIDSDV